MKNAFFAIGILTATFAGTPAYADEYWTADSGLYLSIGGGGSGGGLTESSWESAGLIPPDDLTVTDFHMDYSVVGTGAIGYVWAPPDSPVDFRLELEGSYRLADIDEVKVSVYCLCDGQLVDETSYPAEGYLETIGIMTNGYVDFHLGPRLSPYIGFGIGAARVSRRDLVLTGVGTFSNKFTHTGMWQVSGGIGYRLSPGTILGVEFRRTELGDFRFPSQYYDNEIIFEEMMLTLRLVG